MQPKTNFSALIRSAWRHPTTDVLIRYVFPELWLIRYSFRSARRKSPSSVFQPVGSSSASPPPSSPNTITQKPIPQNQNSNQQDQNPEEIPERHKGTINTHISVPILRTHKPYTPEELEDDLAAIVGLEEVKESIRDIYYTIRVNQERKSHGLRANEQSLHMAFLGNPGTGKTTVARLVGKMFARMGVLSKGHFVETDATGLIGEYVGQTGPKTAQRIKEALGGVLFIDEAYAIIDSERSNINTFGKEAISVLIKGMEDFRDNLCVIFAGYKDEMKAFFDINPGMKSRVPFVLEFEDYTPQELYQIFRTLCMQKQYRITQEGASYLMDLFTRNIGHMKTLGNGRFVRNVLEAAITQQARRIGAMADRTERDLVTLKVEDLQAWENRRKKGGQME